MQSESQEIAEKSDRVRSRKSRLLKLPDLRCWRLGSNPGGNLGGDGVVRSGTGESEFLGKHEVGEGSGDENGLFPMLWYHGIPFPG